MESDVSYFKRRACEERAAASIARDSQARLIHLELAARYESLLPDIIKPGEFVGVRKPIREADAGRRY